MLHRGFEAEGVLYKGEQARESQDSIARAMILEEVCHRIIGFEADGQEASVFVEIRRHGRDLVSPWIMCSRRVHGSLHRGLEGHLSGPQSDSLTIGTLRSINR